jgi:hypothetical protein
MPYATPADIAAYLGISLTAEQQTKATALIAGAESAIDAACNRSWSGGASHTEQFDGGHGRIFPKFVPVDSVSSLSINGTAQVEGEDFFVYDTYIVFAAAPLYGRKSIELVYTADDTVPEAIKQAVIRWVAEQFVGSTNTQTPQTKRLTQGPVTIEYDTTKSPTDPKSGLPTYVEEVVRRFRLPAI